jgi:hypothetical protein
MKKLHICNTLIDAQRLKAALDAAGIATMIKNEYVFGALGQVPLKELMPQLWVLDDADLDAARRVLEDVVDPVPSDAASWRCGVCGERLEAQFDVCWQCGAERPGAG